MSDEKLKILGMVSDGKITAEQALELLKQIPNNDRPQQHPGHGQQDWEHSRQDREHSRQDWEHDRQDWEQSWHDWGHWLSQHPYMPDFGWVDDLGAAIRDTARNAIFPDEFMSGAREEKFSADVGNGIRALEFEGKNAPVKLEAHGGSSLEVAVRYKTKSNWNPHLTFTGENGVFTLGYDDNALYMLGISIRVPETAKIGSVRLKNKNADISVDDITAENIELSTKNSAIKVSDTKGERLYCETKNAPITLDDLEMREIDAQTSNSKISVDDVDAFRARLVTNNAKIDIKDSDIARLYAKTSNSALRFDDMSMKQETDYSIEAATTNGQISVRLPQGEFKCRLRASTTLDGVFSDLRDLEYKVSEKNYAEAQSYGYETAQSKLDMSLQTTNGRIYIKQ